MFFTYFRYKANRAILREELNKLGFKQLVPEKNAGYIITSYLCPKHPNFSFKQFYSKLSDKGICIDSLMYKHHVLFGYNFYYKWFNYNIILPFFLRSSYLPRKGNGCGYISDWKYWAFVSKGFALPHQMHLWGVVGYECSSANYGITFSQMMFLCQIMQQNIAISWKVSEIEIKYNKLFIPPKILWLISHCYVLFNWN